MGTYVNNLRLLEITTGDESGTWGTKTNTNLELIADAFGSGTEAITTNADTHTTTIADGAADEGRAIFLKYTGTLDSACTITIAPNTVNKVWLIENATSGSQNIIISQGSGANITIGNGKIAAVLTDGAGGGAAVLDAFADLELSSTLTVAGNVDFNGALDVDGTTNLDAVDIDGAVQIDSTVTVGVDDTGYDVKFFGDTASAYMLWDTSTDDLVLAGAAGIDLAGDLDVDGTTNLDAVDIDGAVQIDSTVTVGVDDTGYDVKFFGATASAYMLWDESEDDLVLAGAAGIDLEGDIDVNGTAKLDVVDIDGAVDMASTLQVDGAITGSSTIQGTTITATTAFVPDASDGAALGTSSLEFSDLFLADEAVVSFGDGDDVTLTHVHDTGLLLNSTMAIQFNDASQYINAPSNAILDINATDEIELNATAVDLNGTLDVSGTSTLTGAVTTGADLTIPATNKIYLDGGGNTYIRESSADTITFTTENSDNFAFASDGGNPSIQILGNAGGATATVEYSEGGEFFWQHGVRGADEKFYLTGNATLHSSYALMISGQDVAVGGALSKGSGSFKIDHPLPSMKDTHDLYHSFIEGPRADLIYRGQVDLVGGQATVEMDAEFGMTAGTWELLCRDATCFTTNETGWHMVKGSVSGSTLTIECQESDCTDTVSWLVVAERQDQHMYDTEWTDSDGRPILEREKPEEVEDL